MTPRGRAVASTLAAALLFCLPLIPEILGARRLVFRDALITHWPWSRVAAASLSAGELPHINETASGGQPLLANPNAALLYPTKLLSRVLSPVSAFNLHYIGHALWALIGARVLARRLGLSEGPAFLSGIAFAFSGMMLSYVSAFWNAGATASWLPWAAAAAVDLARSHTVREAIRPTTAFGIALGLQALAGEPALSLLTVLFSSILGVTEATEAAEDRGRATLRFVAGSAASGFLAALMAAPLLSPLLEVVGLTERGQRDFSLKEFGSAPLAPWRLFEWILPRFDGDPGALADGAHWQYAFHKGDILYVWCVTLGVLPLFLLLAGAVSRGFWTRRQIVLGATAAVSLLFAFGNRLPFYRALYEIDALRRLRYPIKFYLITTLAAALLAGFAAQRLVEQRLARRTALVLGGGGILLFGLYVGASPAGWVSRGIAPHLAGLAMTPSDILAGILPVIRSDALLGIAALALVVLTLMLPSTALRKTYLLGFATLVMALPWALPLFVAADTRDLAGPPAIRAAMSGPGRLWISPEIPEFNVLETGTRHPEMEPRFTRLARVLIEELVPATGAAFGVRYIFDDDPDGFYAHSHRVARELFNASSAEQKARVLEAYGTRWVLSAETLRLPRAQLVTGFTVAGRRLALWELPRPAAELRWAGRSHGRRSLSGALELVRDEGFDPSNEVVLADRADREPSAPPTSARLSAISIRSSRASADVEADGAGWLLFSRTYFRSWRATVDGQRAPVVIANGRDIAVAVPAGRHKIDLWWDETPFTRGVFLQALGVLFVLAALMVALARHKNLEAPDTSPSSAVQDGSRH